VQYLLENGFFKEILVKDRWGNTPLDDAIRGKHKFIENYLKLKLKERGHASYVSQPTSNFKQSEVIQNALKQGKK